MLEILLTFDDGMEVILSIEEALKLKMYLEEILDDNCLIQDPKHVDYSFFTDADVWEGVKEQ